MAEDGRIDSATPKGVAAAGSTQDPKAEAEAKERARLRQLASARGFGQVSDATLQAQAAKVRGRVASNVAAAAKVQAFAALQARDAKVDESAAQAHGAGTGPDGSTEAERKKVTSDPNANPVLPRVTRNAQGQVAPGLPPQPTGKQALALVSKITAPIAGFDPAAFAKTLSPLPPTVLKSAPAGASPPKVVAKGAPVGARPTPMGAQGTASGAFQPRASTSLSLGQSRAALSAKPADGAYNAGGGLRSASLDGAGVNWWAVYLELLTDIRDRLSQFEGRIAETTWIQRRSAVAGFDAEIAIKEAKQFHDKLQAFLSLGKNALQGVTTGIEQGGALVTMAKLQEYQAAMGEHDELTERAREHQAQADQAQARAKERGGEAVRGAKDMMISQKAREEAGAPHDESLESAMWALAVALESHATPPDSATDTGAAKADGTPAAVYDAFAQAIAAAEATHNEQALAQLEASRMAFDEAQQLTATATTEQAEANRLHGLAKEAQARVAKLEGEVRQRAVDNPEALKDARDMLQKRSDELTDAIKGHRATLDAAETQLVAMAQLGTLESRLAELPQGSPERAGVLAEIDAQQKILREAPEDMRQLSQEALVAKRDAERAELKTREREYVSVLRGTYLLLEGAADNMPRNLEGAAQAASQRIALGAEGPAKTDAEKKQSRLETVEQVAEYQYLAGRKIVPTQAREHTSPVHRTYATDEAEVAALEEGVRVAELFHGDVQPYQDTAMQGIVKGVLSGANSLATPGLDTFAQNMEKVGEPMLYRAVSQMQNRTRQNQRKIDAMVRQQLGRVRNLVAQLVQLGNLMGPKG